MASALLLFVPNCAPRSWIWSLVGWAKKLAGHFTGRQPRIVAPVAVEGGKPEEHVAANVAAHADAPGHLVVGGRKGLGRKHRNGGRGGWGGLLHPLGKGVARPPGVLAVEQKALAVQEVGAALGFNFYASARGARAFGFHVAGHGAHLADGGFADLKAASAGPGLPHAVRFGQARAGRGLLLRAGRGCGPFAKDRANAGAINGEIGRLLAGAAQRGLGGVSRSRGGRRIQNELFPAPSAYRQRLQLGGGDGGVDCRSGRTRLPRGRLNAAAHAILLRQAPLLAGPHSRFTAGRNHDAVEMQMAQLATIGLEAVLACLESGESIIPVPCRGGAHLDAGGAVAQNNGSSGQRSRIDAGEFAAE